MIILFLAGVYFYKDGMGEGAGCSIKLPYLMAYQLYPWYVAYIYLLAIHISGMTCCYGQLYCLKLQELCIWYTNTRRQIAICGVTCCHRHFVTTITEACPYNFTVWSCRNFIFSTQIPLGNNNLWRDLLLWTSCNHCKQSNVLITLLSEVVETSCLLHRSYKATAIYGMTCCYWHFVAIAMEVCPHNFTDWSVETSYLVQRSYEATAICGIICCNGHLITMTTEACPYNFTVWSCKNFFQ